MTLRLVPIAAALAFSLIACSPAAEAPSSSDAPEVVAEGTAPSPPVAPQPPSEPVAPAPNDPATPSYDETLVNWGGYRTAPFNGDAAAVRAAATETLTGEPDPDNGPDGCYYLMPPTDADGYRYAFMMEGGKFVRLDVKTADIVAPGGIVPGMTKADVLAAFPQTVQQPHHYTDGQYLVVAPADGGEARLVFEVDAAGTIERWRIGLEPQVHYVEGCS
jgi:hypothetical protein